VNASILADTGGSCEPERECTVRGVQGVRCSMVCTVREVMRCCVVPVLHCARRVDWPWHLLPAHPHPTLKPLERPAHTRRLTSFTGPTNMPPPSTQPLPTTRTLQHPRASQNRRGPARGTTAAAPTAPRRRRGSSSLATSAASAMTPATTRACASCAPTSSPPRVLRRSSPRCSWRSRRACPSQWRQQWG